MELSSWSRPRDDMAWYGEKIVTAPIFSIGFEARHQGVVEGCFQFASNKASRGMVLSASMRRSQSMLGSFWLDEKQ